MTLGGDLDQLARHLANAVLELGLARLPARAAEPVEFHRGAVRAIARQQLDVFDRQKQLGITGVMQFEAVMRRAADFQRLQPDKAADAVLDMHHDVAGRQAGDFGNEIVELAAGAPRPHQTVAENVLLADHRKGVGLETGLHAEHRQHGLVARRGLHHAPGIDAGDVVQLVVGQHARHALARAFAPQRHHHLFARGLQAVDMRDQGLEHIDRTISTLRRKIAALLGAGIDHRAALFGHRERRQPRQRPALQPLVPFVFGKIEPVRRQRIVDRAAARQVARFLPRQIVIGDLF